LLMKMDLSSRPFLVIRLALLGKIVGTFLEYLIALHLTHTKDVSQAYMSFLLTQPFVIPLYMEFSAKVTYHNLICDYALSGTFLAVLNSLANFASIFFQPIFTLMLEFCSFKLLVPFALIYSVVYLICVMPRIIAHLETCERNDFAISRRPSYSKPNEGKHSNLVS